jgi:hypothetical protein
MMFGFRTTAFSSAIILAGAASAIFAAAGAANAQDCVNGWKMVKDQIPVACSTFGQHTAFGVGTQQNEPLTTGSIRTAESPAVAKEQTHTDAVGNECSGGYRWDVTPANGATLPMRCD